MVSWEMERPIVVLQKERLEVCKRVLLSEQAPDAVFIIGSTIAELNRLQLGKLFYQALVAEGSDVPSPARFASLLVKLMLK